MIRVLPEGRFWQTAGMTQAEKSKPSTSPPQSEDGWFVYILRCSDNTLYTGITKDLERRLQQHNAGTASRYTRSRLPAEMVYQETQPNQSAALKRELAIKALPREEKLLLISTAVEA